MGIFFTNAPKFRTDNNPAARVLQLVVQAPTTTAAPCWQCVQEHSNTTLVEVWWTSISTERKRGNRLPSQSVSFKVLILAVDRDCGRFACSGARRTPDHAIPPDHAVALHGAGSPADRIAPNHRLTAHVGSPEN